MNSTPKKRWWGLALLCSVALAAGAGAGAHGQEALPAQPDTAAASCSSPGGASGAGGLWFGGLTHHHAL
jgi:hypothetical protein